MKKLISGIQQMGVGIPNVKEATAYYREMFGFHVSLFDDEGTAALMLPYTNGKPQNRHAVLALNMKGGGGMEIWQYTTRTPLAPDFEVQWGDLGILACKLKCESIDECYKRLSAKGMDVLSKPTQTTAGTRHFFVRDPYNNIFELIDGLPFFGKGKGPIGGVGGAVIGVSQMDAARLFYATVLGYDQVLSDETGTFADFGMLPGGKKIFRRVLLGHSEARKGAFSHLLGPSQIELVEAQDYPARKIYQDRQWGDLGFIHLCFDVKGMDLFKTDCATRNYPFTVDSGGNFDMGEAAGRFAYIEDPDGTLIELVETYKIPILKKIGWYLDLRKKNPEQRLPDWMLKLLGL